MNHKIMTGFAVMGLAIFGIFIALTTLEPGTKPPPRPDLEHRDAISHNLPELDPVVNKAPEPQPKAALFTVGMSIEAVMDAFPKYNLITWEDSYECAIYAAPDPAPADTWVAPVCHFREADHCVFEFDLKGELTSWHGNTGFPAACKKLEALHE